ncbi:MAG: NTP transferase domain-containing protein [Thaumarchaeota archaeon]|nr:NTP transferase domain-containing protein [Nitrososphaerota archaeon]
MNIVALLMAGGKGSRLGKGEKPLLEVSGKPMIQHVINALRACKNIRRVIVAVSSNTPKTALIAKKFGAEVVETEGLGYVEDLRYAIKKLGLRETIIISADMPCIRPTTLDLILARFESCSKAALSVMVPVSEYRKIGVEPEIIFNIEGLDVVPAGVNVLDGSAINGSEPEQEDFIVYDAETLINVNSPKDLAVAERIFSKSLLNSIS